jgi:hypothetical protein
MLTFAVKIVSSAMSVVFLFSIGCALGIVCLVEKIDIKRPALKPALLF